MAPGLMHGDQVHLRQQNPRIGDVIVFSNGADLLVHRIYFRLGKQYWTMGDNASAPDPGINADQIIAVADMPSVSCRHKISSLFKALKFHIRRKLS